MLNSLLKLTLVAALVRWLKPRYRMIVISAILILVVNLAHSEYIEYVTITSQFDYLELSYLLKYVFWVTILAVYYFVAEVRTIVGKADAKSAIKAPPKRKQVLAQHRILSLPMASTFYATKRN